jgi:hypothetical protein
VHANASLPALVALGIETFSRTQDTAFSTKIFMQSREHGCERAEVCQAVFAVRCIL